MYRIVFAACLLIFAAASVGASESKEAAMTARRDPVVSTVCSVVIPGAGQAYNRQWLKAGICFVGSSVGYSMFFASLEENEDGELELPEDETLATIGFLVSIGSHLYSIIDAPITSNSINKRHRQAHVIQHDGERFSLGFDPITSRRGLGTRGALRF